MKTQRRQLTKRACALAGAMLFSAIPACSSDSNGDSNSDSTPATLADFCGKCAECVFQAGFSEGFCTPWVDGTAFDRLACSSKADTTQLDNQALAASQLQSMSCQAFDDAE